MVVLAETQIYVEIRPAITVQKKSDGITLRFFPCDTSGYGHERNVRPES